MKAMIFLFAFLLFSVCCSAHKPFPTLPPSDFLPVLSPIPFPDLTISDPSLDESEKLVVKITNIGEGPAPIASRNLMIFWGDNLKWEGSL